LDYFDIVKSEARSNNVSPYLIQSIIKSESGFHKQAISSAGAIGLMQIKPDTAKWCAAKMGISAPDEMELYQPEINIKIGTWYFASFLLPKYDGDVDKALAAYNAGHGNVDSWDEGEILFPETQKYVKKVKWYNGLYGWMYKNNEQ
jgi:soluble lytic murein transglycosylase